MGQHARYTDQDGVNVVHIHVDIADPPESADMGNTSCPLLLPPPFPSSSLITPQHLHLPPPLFPFQPLFFFSIKEGSAYSSYSEDAAKKNQVRFYRTSQKLSDGGGGMMVYYNGKKIEHKKVVMGSLNALVEAIAAALEKQNSH